MWVIYNGDYNLTLNKSNTTAIETSDNSLRFFTVGDYYSPALLGYSLIGFYTAVIYVIGSALRLAISSFTQSFLLSDCPDPDSLIELLEALYTARQEKDLYREELLYYYLLDLLRSPETIKKLTGSCVEYIEARRLDRLNIYKEGLNKKADLANKHAQQLNQEQS